MKYIFSDNTVQGIGCISLQDLKKGEIVGKEPYFICKKYKEFFDYYWNVEGQNILINGLGNYCNHSDSNNIMPILKFTNEPFITFIAIKDIKKGEELFNNYGPNYWKYRNKYRIEKNKKIQELVKKNNKIRNRFKMFF